MKSLMGVLVLALLVTIAAFYAARPRTLTLDQRIDASLSRAARILVISQAPDGSFQSDVYGSFKNNLTLTPHVLYALQCLPASLQTPQVTEARHRAAARLATLAHDSPSMIPYAVYTIAGTIRCLAREPDFASAIPPLVALLRQHQLAEERGWSPADLSYGGWGYSDLLPDKPGATLTTFNAVNANLSATLYALEALHAAGTPTNDQAVQKALTFVRRCQNYRTQQPDGRFDDGGFFFSPEEVMRNKAAEAGTDGTTTRYRSYGSMTCDGLRALVLCDRATGDADVAAAVKWIHDHFAVVDQPGDFPPERRMFQLGMYFYYLSSLAQVPPALHHALPADWNKQLAIELLARQGNDGAWVNRYTDAKEDDPLVATLEAVIALSAVREELETANHRPPPR